MYLTTEEQLQCDEMLSDLNNAVAENNKTEIERNIEDFNSEFYTSDLTQSQLDFINNAINNARSFL